jgi:hypothetical protein
MNGKQAKRLRKAAGFNSEKTTRMMPIGPRRGSLTDAAIRLAQALGMKIFQINGKVFASKAVRISTGPYREYRVLKQEYKHGE